MAGFTSYDDYINQVSTNGKSWRADWNKNMLGSAAVVGEWHCLFRGAGSPGADATLSTTTNLAAAALSDAVSTATGILHNGNVGGGTGFKHIVYASGGSAAATTAPAILMLVDLLLHYRVTSITTTGNQATNNTVTLPRYTTGAGVQAFCINNNTSTTNMGAATPNLSITYTNAAGTGSKTTPATLPACKSAATPGQIVYSGTGSGKYGPFIPLAAGDTGIRTIDQINLSASYVSGELSMILCKPLFSLPIATQGVICERSFMMGDQPMPKVYDGACLAWLLYSGAATPANSGFYGHLDFAWS